MRYPEDSDTVSDIVKIVHYLDLTVHYPTCSTSQFLVKLQSPCKYAV